MVDPCVHSIVLKRDEVENFDSYRLSSPAIRQLLEPELGPT
jgi:hypothetical protein